MPGPRRATRLRRPPRARREPEVEKPKVLTPREKMRNLMIHSGVIVLVFAFLLTSGIVCINLNPPAEQQQGGPGQPVQDELAQQLDYWKGQLTSNPGSSEAMANIAVYTMEQALTKPPDQRKPLLDEAQKQLDAALAKGEGDANYVFALQTMARLKAIREDYAGAREMYEKALGLADRPIPEGEDKTSFEAARRAEKETALLGLAEMSYHEKKPDEAIARLGQVLELNPSSTQAYLMRAQIQREAGKKDEAIKDLQYAQQVATSMEQQIMIQMQLQDLQNPQGTPTPGAPPASPEAAPAPVAPATPAAPTTTAPTPVAGTPTPAATP